MNEKATKYFTSVKTFWGKQSKKNKTTFFCILSGIIIVAIVLTILLNLTQYKQLYVGLDKDEEIEITRLLQTSNTNFKTGQNGEILVPADSEAAVRMQLASQGYPKTAPNYDYFEDNIDVMTTDFEKREIKIQQLNMRLQESIRTINGVKGAIVTISVPESNGYAWEKNEETPTASVLIDLTQGVILEPTQVNGVEQLIIKSVPGMKKEDVAIVDNNGNVLKSSGSDNFVEINKFKIEIENQYQKEIERNVIKVLEPTFGKNNVIISAKCDMNLDKKIQEIITYSPSGDGNTGVISEKETVSEAVGANGATGVPGENDNEDIPQYQGVTTDGQNIYYKDQQSYKYLVSQIKEQIDHDSVQINDLTLAITINKAEIEATDRLNLTQLIANAAGVQTDKITIYNSLFSNNNQINVPANTPTQPIDPMILYVLIGGGVLIAILILLVIFLLLKSKKRKKHKIKEVEKIDVIKTEEPEEMFDPGQISQDLNKKRETKEQALKEGIQDFSAQNPEIVAQLIKTWLKGEDD